MTTPILSSNIFTLKKRPEGGDPETTTDQPVTFTTTEVTEVGTDVMTEADVTVKMTEPGMAIEITQSGITVGMTEAGVTVKMTEPGMSVEIAESGITAGITDKVTEVATEKVTVVATEKVTDVATGKITDPNGVSDAELITGEPDRMDYIVITPESDKSDTDMSGVTEPENRR